MPRYPAGLGSEKITMQQLMVLLHAHGVSKEDAIVFGAIADAESSLHPRAVGDINKPKAGYESLGLFQINVTPQQQQDEGDRLLTADYNVASAVAIRAKRGFKPWTTYTSGSYVSHLFSSRAAADVEYSGVPSGTLGAVVGGSIGPATAPLQTPLVGTISTVADAVAVLGRAAVWVANRENWVRVFEIVVGVVAGVVGIVIVSRDLSGPIAKNAAKVAPLLAV